MADDGASHPSPEATDPPPVTAAAPKPNLRERLTKLTTVADRLDDPRMRDALRDLCWSIDDLIEGPPRSVHDPAQPLDDAASQPRPSSGQPGGAAKG